MDVPFDVTRVKYDPLQCKAARYGEKFDDGRFIRHIAKQIECMVSNI